MADKKTASFMRSLCMGRIEEDIILPFPALSTSEKETLEGVFTTLSQLLEPHEADFRFWDRKGELPPEFVNQLREAGLFSFVIPEEHGGLGFGSKAYSRALQQVARYDASVAVTVGAHSSIGMRGLLLFGTEDQRARFRLRGQVDRHRESALSYDQGSGSSRYMVGAHPHLH